MTKLEVAKLAFKISKRLYSHFGMRESVKLMAGEFVDVINIINEEYDIVKRI